MVPWHTVIVPNDDIFHCLLANTPNDLLEDYGIEEIAALVLEAALNCVQGDIAPEEYLYDCFPHSVIANHNAHQQIQRFIALTVQLIAHLKCWHRYLFLLLTTKYANGMVVLSVDVLHEFKGGFTTIKIL